MTQTEPFDPRSFHAQYEIAMIVACSKNGFIGRDGDLPWHLPADLLHFMRSTKGCPVIMGRKTFDSLDKPLPHRLNIVVSRSMTDSGLDCVQVARDLDSAINQARETISGGQDRPIWIAGGGTIYKQAMERADLIVRTLIDLEIDGDASFPEIDPAQWSLSRAEPHQVDERHKYPFEFQWWKRA